MMRGGGCIHRLARRPYGARGSFWRFSQDCVRRGGLHPGLFSSHPSGMRVAEGIA